jgi:heme-degrading monooxygenase HmoA|eukprot:m.426093 g.426093  ORF g.426093 m.426093 type:complete len:126 (-) comp56353_c0_seq1:100-477(-)
MSKIKNSTSGYIAETPELPYYAVIFSNTRTHTDDDGYGATAKRMVELGTAYPGFLGIESVREGHDGITVSYWRSKEDIARWRADAEHRVAQETGQTTWYSSYCLRVAKVERQHHYIAPLTSASKL